MPLWVHKSLAVTNFVTAFFVHIPFGVAGREINARIISFSQLLFILL